MTKSQFNIGEAYRIEVRAFVAQHIKPHIQRWEQDAHIPKSIWGKLMTFTTDCMEKYGRDHGKKGFYFYDVVLIEELAKLNYGGFAASYGICQLAKPYLENHGSEFVKATYLNPIKTGEMWCAIAITEPTGGSDVAQIKTTAHKKGTQYLLNGSKTFITNGMYADFYLVAVKILESEVPRMSLLLVDANSVGITKSVIPKMGWHCSDTASIGFDNVKVPVENLVGQTGYGFQYLMENFQNERLYVAVMAVADMEDFYGYTKNYLLANQKKLNPYQSLELSKMYADITLYKHYVYHCCAIFDSGKYAVMECTIAKKTTSEALIKIVNECMELLKHHALDEKFEGSRRFRDSRISTIGGGTSDIMSEILSKIILDHKVYVQNMSLV